MQYIIVLQIQKNAFAKPQQVNVVVKDYKAAMTPDIAKKSKVFN